MFYVTRLHENANYELISQKKILERDTEMNGVLKDEIICLKTEKGPLKVRLITFKSLTTGKTYTFGSNMFDVETTILQSYIRTGGRLNHSSRT